MPHFPLLFQKKEVPPLSLPSSSEDVLFPQDAFSSYMLLPASYTLPSFGELPHQSYFLKESFLSQGIPEPRPAFPHFAAFPYQKSGWNPLHPPTAQFEPEVPPSTGKCQ